MSRSGLRAAAALLSLSLSPLPFPSRFSNLPAPCSAIPLAVNQPYRQDEILSPWSAFASIRSPTDRFLVTRVSVSSHPSNQNFRVIEYSDTEDRLHSRDRCWLIVKIIRIEFYIYSVTIYEIYVYSETFLTDKRIFINLSLAPMIDRITFRWIVVHRTNPINRRL